MKQQGMALFVSMIFLLILTILGITSMRSTIMQEQMAGNYNDYIRAVQAAEIAARKAETWLKDRSSLPESSNSPGASQVWNLMDASSNPSAGGENCDNNNTMWWRQCGTAWWATNAVQISNADGHIDLSDTTLPRYTIEERAFVKDSLTIGERGRPSGRNIYRITARGTGANTLTQVLIQSTYARRF